MAALEGLHEHERRRRGADPQGRAQAARPVPHRAAQEGRLAALAEASATTSCPRCSTSRATIPSAEVRGDAIFWLSQTQLRAGRPGARLRALLGGRRRDAQEGDLRALAAEADERARQAIRRAAEDEKMSEEIRGEAIFWLGQANLADLEYFKTLFRKTTNVDLRKKIVFAVSQTRLPERERVAASTSRATRAPTSTFARTRSSSASTGQDRSTSRSSRRSMTSPRAKPRCRSRCSSCSRSDASRPPSTS